MAHLAADTPVRFVRGVGPLRSEQLQQAGIHTVADVLYLRPLRYEEQPACRPIGEWRDGEVACIAGEIRQVRRGGTPGKPLLAATVSDGSEQCRVLWFHMPHLGARLGRGMGITATGRIRATAHGVQLINPSFRLFEDSERVEIRDRQQLRAVYRTVGPLTARQVGRIVEASLAAADAVADPLPRSWCRDRDLPDLASALRQLHQPETVEAAERARLRLAYDELLSWQLRFARARSRRRQHSVSRSFQNTEQIDHRIRQRLGFTLTADQDRAVAQISADLARRESMFRLLQGDVGSGKTAVALYAALVAIANRGQVALLAPTEVLARQHDDKIRAYLRHSAVRTALITGALAAKARRQLCDDLQSGAIDLVVGTHALLEPEVTFARLGLVIIDEQHRFGVHQRKAMAAKGQCPHYLILSATPIPRTQALAILGDLEISTLRTLPKGRRRVKTILVGRGGAASAWSAIRGQLSAGRQAYVVFPLVDESDKVPLKSVRGEVDRLGREELKGFECLELHGRLSSIDKQRAIDAFRDGAVQVLVCTTVVEVGIDIPNATVMAVFHAERYGLAQLHQLRGRIGRAGDEAYLYLFTDATEDTARARLEVLTRTDDGFKIAEADLRLRGPGELLSVQQHGLPNYRFAELAGDIDLLQIAQRDARDILAGESPLGPEQCRRIEQVGLAR